MANYNFKEDILVGENGEKTIIKDLQSLGATFIKTNNDYRYDLLMKRKGQEITYEVKTDVYCKPSYDTGNMFIEFECRGYTSGLYVTEAKWFVMYYKYLNEAWYIKTEDFKKLIDDNEESLRITQFSGDMGSNTRGYLIPREVYKDSFIVRSL